MKINKILMFSICFSLLFAGGVIVSAEEVENTPVLLNEETEIETQVQETQEVQEDQVVQEEILEEEMVEQIPERERPSNFSLWFLGMKEKVSLAFTFNQEKRIEKTLSFAEKRTELAEIFAEKAEGEDGLEKAQQMMERADAFLLRAEEKKSEVEEKVREKIEERTNKMEDRLRFIENFQEEKSSLIERIQEGDEGAQEQLKRLQAERTRELKERAEQQKGFADELRGGSLERTEERNELREENREEYQERQEEVRGDQQEVRARINNFVPEIVGNDRDEHGCIGSAGYVWCEAKGECLRPFEEGWDESCEVQNQERTREQESMSQEMQVELLPTTNNSVSPTDPLNRMVNEEVEKIKGFLKAE